MTASTRITRRRNGAVSAVADAGVDADALAERLQRHGAGAFRADWTALLTATEEKAQKLKPEASE